MKEIIDKLDLIKIKNFCFVKIHVNRMKRQATDYEKIFAKHTCPDAAAAAAAAKLLQSCPSLCDPIDGSRPGSPVPGILQARTLEWVAISFSNA